MQPTRLASGALVLLLLGAGCMAPAPSDEVLSTSELVQDAVCHARLRGFDLHHTTIAETQTALAEGRITSVELVDAYLARIEAFDRNGPALNSVINLNPTARDQAARLDAERQEGNVRGPLHGITVLLKDVIGTNDVPTTAGSIALEVNVPPVDSTVVARLREAGVVILGKANLNEFSNWMDPDMPMGYSSLGGQLYNAYTGGDPGGSSSGSGVAGSMAFATVAMGTDTTGSVTYPSIMNSLAGIRASHALVSHAGIIPIIPHFDLAGPMGRNVEDVAAVLGVIVGPDPKDPFTSTSPGHFPENRDYVSGLDADSLRGVRLGYQDEASGEIWQRVRAELEALGAVLVPVDWDSNAQSTAATGQIAGLAANEFKFSINWYLAQEAGPGLPVETLSDIIAYNNEHPERVKYGQDYLIASDATPGLRQFTDAGAQAAWRDSRATADALFQRYDVKAFIGIEDGISTWSAFTAAAQYPNMVVPAGYDEQQPIGLSFFGPEWSEQELLSYAYAYEQATMVRRAPEAVNPDLLAAVCPDGTPLGVDEALGRNG